MLWLIIAAGTVLTIDGKPSQVGTPGAAAQQQAPPIDSQNVWITCLNSTTSRWLALKDDATTLADGAFGQCSKEEEQARLAFELDVLKQAPIRASTIDADGARYLANMKSMLRGLIIARILNKRAEQGGAN